MGRRRAFWLVVWPAFAVLAALVVGVAALGTATLVAAPGGDGADVVPADGQGSGVQLVLDRAAAGGDVLLGELTSAPVALASAVLGLLGWLVLLGVGAQRYFPEGRRLAPAALTVLATVVVAAVGGAIGGDLGFATLTGVVPMVATSALVAGVAVFPLAGHRWQAPAPRHHHEPAVYAHLADILQSDPARPSP